MYSAQKAIRRGGVPEAVLALALGASPVGGCYTGPATGLDQGAASGQDGGSAADGAPCGPNPATGDLPCDVSAVLVDKCQSCHQDPPRNNAPWALLTYEDTQMPYGNKGKLRWQRMAEVVEPGAIPSMPLPPAPPLTATQLDSLRGWFKACAPPVPEGQGCDTGEP